MATTTWGDKLRATQTTRQAKPRNQKLLKPRSLAVKAKQPQSSNNANVRNVPAQVKTGADEE